MTSREMSEEERRQTNSVLLGPIQVALQLASKYGGDHRIMPTLAMEYGLSPRVMGHIMDRLVKQAESEGIPSVIEYAMAIGVTLERQRNSKPNVVSDPTAA